MGNGCVLEERDRAVHHRRPHLLVATSRQLECNHREPRDIVDAVAGLAVRDDAVGVLHDPDVVDEREDVIGLHVRDQRLRAGRRATSWRHRDCLLEDGGRRLRNRRPAQLGADPSCLGAGIGEDVRILDVATNRIGQRGGIVERDERSRAGRQQVLRVPVRCRDDATTGCDREGERAGGDLLLAAVRRDEHVRGREEISDLLDGQEPAVELDVVLETEIENGLLE